MRWQKPNHSAQMDEENPYWMSFSDMMASLLVIFILATIALILELSTKQENLDKDLHTLKKAENVRRDILNEVKYSLSQQNIFVEVADNDTVLRIPERTLNFPSGSYDIPINYRANIQEIGNILFDSINRKDEESHQPRYTFLDTIFIEGHTDIIPYQNPSIKGNWGLSTFRAISVWQFWLESNGESKNLSSMRNHSNKALFSVSGYGETRPPECEDSCKVLTYKEQLERMRRIDIRFTVKKPTEQEYQEIKRKSNE